MFRQRCIEVTSHPRLGMKNYRASEKTTVTTCYISTGARDGGGAVQDLGERRPTPRRTGNSRLPPLHCTLAAVFSAESGELRSTSPLVSWHPSTTATSTPMSGPHLVAATDSTTLFSRRSLRTLSCGGPALSGVVDRPLRARFDVNRRRGLLSASSYCTRTEYAGTPQRLSLNRRHFSSLRSVPYLPFEQTPTPASRRLSAPLCGYFPKTRKKSLPCARRTICYFAPTLLHN